jgi:hypothetical protein
MTSRAGRASSPYRRIVAASLCAVLVSSNAEAALLTNIQGAVFVNRGDGFKPVSGPASVADGDRVRVDAGSAVVVYDDGYSQSIGPDQTLLVHYEPPVVYGGGLKDGVVESPPIGGDPLIAAALLAGGVGLAAAIASTGQDFDQPPQNPMSP